MIPAFPKFKKLEITDKHDIEKITKQFPPYSDFNFTSMFCWDVGNSIEISALHENLIVRFSDYTSGKPFFSFIGKNKVYETAKATMDFSMNRGYGSALKLLPKLNSHSLPRESEFIISPNRDQDDYVYSVSNLLSKEGKKFETFRNQLNRFNRRYPSIETGYLNPQDPGQKREIMHLFSTWETEKKMLLQREQYALERCMEFLASENFATITLRDSRKGLIGFSIIEKISNVYAICHFAKANFSYSGIYYRLMHETARFLNHLNIPYLNYEQDLGENGLRVAKMYFDPVFFLKKFELSFSLSQTKVVDKLYEYSKKNDTIKI